MLQATETTRYFDRHASRYDELVSTVAFQLDDAYDYLAKYIREAHSDRQSVQVLELGIGTGRFTSQLLRINPTAVVTGIDVSAPMLESAEGNLDKYRDRVTLVRGEFPNAIPDNEYDCVVSAIALSFYSIDFSALFRKVHSVLPPGGIFAYAVNVAQNASSVDRILMRMLREQVEVTEEQLRWLKSIKQDVKFYQVPLDWHRTTLHQGGFCDIDCIYLRHKLAIFSGTKPRTAL